MFLNALYHIDLKTVWFWEIQATFTFWVFWTKRFQSGPECTVGWWLSAVVLKKCQLEHQLTITRCFDQRNNFYAINISSLSISIAYFPFCFSVFHDCVSDSCDGCINIDNDSNNGLSNSIENLDTLYLGTYDSLMSRADFWTLAAIAAIERGTRKANGEQCSFGR